MEGGCTWRPRRRAASSTIPPLAQFTMRTPSLHKAIVSSPAHAYMFVVGVQGRGRERGEYSIDCSILHRSFFDSALQSTVLYCAVL